MAKRFQHAVVVGASSGIGRELVRQLASGGCSVCAIARREDLLDILKSERPNRIITRVHDVTRIEEIPAVFQEVTGALGGLDLIIYAAGIMHPVEWDEFDTEKDLDMVEVNTTAAVAWLNQAAIRFQGTKHGTVVGIGSAAGERGRGSLPVYGASKAFLKCYLESLRNRLSSQGVHVVTVKPGPVDTEMTRLSDSSKMPVDVAAAKILKLAKRNGEYFLSPLHVLIFYVIRNIPSFIFRKLKL